MRVLDVLPTLFDIAGLETPPTFAGRPLQPLLHGESEEPRIAFSEGTLYGSDRLSWRTERYHLLFDRSPTATRALELYDWTADPTEQNDLAPSQPKLTQSLFGDLRRFHDNLTARATQLSTPELQNIHPRRIARMEASLQSLGYTGRDEQPAEEEDE